MSAVTFRQQRDWSRVTTDNRSRITDNSVRAGFTLLELLLVLGIMLALTVLVVPAFTNRKSADDLTRAADTVKGVLEKARTYAQANNTYTWVGFYEEDGSVPSASPTATPGTGRLVMSVVASTNGTNLGADVSNTANAQTIPATSLSQVGTLTKIDNVHLPLLAVPSPTPNCQNVDCTTFDNRPPIQYDPGAVGYNDSRFGEINGTSPNIAPYSNNGVTLFPFQYPVGGTTTPPALQYFFQRTIRFSPTGENRINSTYDVRTLVEIGLLQTRGNVAPTPTSGGGTSTAVYPGNVLAIQIGGFDGNVKIYRR